MAGVSESIGRVKLGGEFIQTQTLCVPDTFQLGAILRFQTFLAAQKINVLSIGLRVPPPSLHPINSQVKRKNHNGLRSSTQSHSILIGLVIFVWC
jgi:hypothetical protein